MTARERVESIRYELTKPVQSQFIKNDCQFLVEQYDALTEALRPIVKEYNLWSEDANDGEFRLWDLDRLVVAIVKARATLGETDQ